MILRFINRLIDRGFNKAILEKHDHSSDINSDCKIKKLPKNNLGSFSVASVN